jgi:hypothetical protein
MPDERWLTDKVTTIAQAAAHIDQLGFALLFPTDHIDAPTLWAAVAGPGVEPVSGEFGETESTIWGWKDQLSAEGLAWYGRFLYRRGSFLSPRLLAALYPHPGDEDDSERLDLPTSAQSIARALLSGPMTTAALRDVVGDRKAYDKGSLELQRRLLICAAGVRQQKAGWPASLVDLTCRRFTVGGRYDPDLATQIYLDTAADPSPRDLARAFNWPLPVAKDHLAAAEVA